MSLFSASFDSPFAPLYLAADDCGLCYLGLAPPPFATDIAYSPFLEQAKEQLQSYFRDPSISFNIALSLKGTDLQKKIWCYISQNILSGQRASYLSVAKSLKTGARVVGQSMKRNPVPLFVPCHRVVGHDGRLGGYSLGGQKVKRFLLEHEDPILRQGSSPSLF